jgi:hypothetical protein
LRARERECEQEIDPQEIDPYRLLFLKKFTARHAIFLRPKRRVKLRRTLRRERGSRRAKIA